jgi:hypothetical protein
MSGEIGGGSSGCQADELPAISPCPDKSLNVTNFY